MLYFQLCNTSPVRSRTEKADAMTFVSQLNPQTSSWFDRSSFEVQQCRTPSTVVYRFHLRLRRLSTMSNSIDQLYIKSSLVEFHQHLSKMVCPSTMSNSIDYPTLIQSCVQSRDSSRTIKHGELSSCAIHTLNNCNLTSNAA